MKNMEAFQNIEANAHFLKIAKLFDNPWVNYKEI